MAYKQEHIDLIENIIKKSPGFRGNEDLLEEMVKGTLNKSQSFLDGSMDAPSMEVYIKRIAVNVIVEVVKNAEEIRANKDNIVKDNIILVEEEPGEITFDFEIPEVKDKPDTSMSDERITTIKQKIIELDKQNSSKNYKQIFELRIVREMNTQEIAKKLEMKENEVSQALIELYKEVDSV